MMAAPSLLMPQEKDRLDEEMDLLYNPSEAQSSVAGSRMGGRIGARPEGLQGEEVPQNLNQLRNRHSDDDPQIEEDDQKISREPEREPSKDPNLLEEQKQGAEDPFG